MRIITNGNSALIEYPECPTPEFELDKNGTLFIFGYSMMFVGKEIGVMRKFETKLINYKIIGKYNESIINQEITEIINSQYVDLENAIILTK